MVTVGSLVYFTATDPVKGIELWKTDGTTAGTEMVKDINPGLASSNPSALCNVNGTLFFAATKGVNGIEVWKTDGTESVSVMVVDIS